MKNEQIKLFSRFATWSMFIIIAVIIIASGIITFIFDDFVTKDYGDNWRTELQEENADFEEMMEGEYMEGAYTGEIERNNYHLENDIKPSSYDGWQFTLDNAGLSMMISLFTIIIAAGMIASEFRWGTIKLLLIRPISRTKIMFSKYATVLLFALSMLIFLFVINLIVGAIFFGINGLNPTFVQSTMSGFQEVGIMKEIFTEYGLQMIKLVMMATFAFMISSLFRNSGMAIGLAIFLMFAGNMIVGVLSQYEWSKYILFANTDLSQYQADRHPMIEGMTMGFSVTILVIYYIIYHGLHFRTVTGNSKLGG